MNPDNTKLSDCHNFVTDSTNPAEIKCCCCGQICTWHPGEPAVPATLRPPTKTVQATAPELKTPETVASGKPTLTQTDFQPRNKREFEYYKSWRMASPLASNQSDETLVNMGFDAEAIEILKIRNQKEFAEKFGVHEMTLSDWNKIIDENKAEDRFDWAKKLSKNMLMAMYRSALKKGGADQIMTWFRIVEDWTPKTETKIEDSRETTRVRNKLYEIMEEWTDDQTDQKASDGNASGVPPAQQ